MKWFRLARARTPSAEPAPLPADRPWKELALEAAGIWLRVDESLRVVEVSAEAAAFFGRPTLPASLVTVTRSAAAETVGRRATTGEEGPWEFEAAHFQRSFRARALPLGREGTLLFLDDITELRRLEAMRADFVANLAHEMRTPVASLSLAAETLATDLPPHEQRRFIDRIAEETRYIEGLLRSVSELALLEGDVRLALTEFPLREVVDESWQRVVARQGPATLENEVSGEVIVCADRVRIAEVFQNLLENAHRFSPPGERVSVTACPADGGDVEVTVADRGPGIPPAQLPRVFERFYKVDRARTRSGEGSGLGLAISKHLVTAHGGRIWARAGEDGGTVVAFTIPGRPSDAA